MMVCVVCSAVLDGGDFIPSPHYQETFGNLEILWLSRLGVG